MPIENKHPTASKGSNQYQHPRGHLRPERFEGEIMRAAPYELGGDDYQSETRDYKGIPVTFRSPDGKIVEPDA